MVGVFYDFHRHQIFQTEFIQCETGIVGNERTFDIFTPKQLAKSVVNQYRKIIETAHFIAIVSW